jgi:excisionase family DNA binding protein
MAKLSPKAVAEKYGKSPLTIYRWIYRGVIPARKIGGNWFIDEAELDQVTNPATVTMTLENYVAAVVEAAPELTSDQLIQIREALGRRSE